MTYSESEIFTDHLTVTFSPENSPSDLVENFFISIGCLPVHGNDPTVRSFRTGCNGWGHIREKKRYTSIEASGRFLYVMRTVQVFNEYLSLLSTCPHKVTRLDAALDVGRDFVDWHSEFVAKYPRRKVPLMRKGAIASEVMGPRDDGKMSGSVYIGQRGKNRQIMRVYDKTKEALDRRGEIIPPTVRYEVEVGRNFGATLRDAADPTSLFYHVASPSILPLPGNIPSWSSHAFDGWKFDPDSLVPHELMVRLFENSVEIPKLLSLADDVGTGGRRSLARLLLRQLDLSLADRKALLKPIS